MFPVKSVGQSTNRSVPVCQDRSVPLCRNRSAPVDHQVGDMEEGEAALEAAMEVRAEEGVMEDHRAQAGEDQEALMMAYCQEVMVLDPANPRGRSRDMAKGQQTPGCISQVRTVNPAQGHQEDQASGGARVMAAAAVEVEDLDIPVEEEAMEDHPVDHPVQEDSPVEGEAIQDLPVEAVPVVAMEVDPLEVVGLFPGNNAEQFRNSNVEMFLPRSAAL